MGPNNSSVDMISILHYFLVTLHTTGNCNFVKVNTKLCVLG